MSVSVSEISSTGGLMTAGLETTKVDIIHHLLDTGAHWAMLGHTLQYQDQYRAQLTGPHWHWDGLFNIFTKITFHLISKLQEPAF